MSKDNAAEIVLAVATVGLIVSNIIVIVNLNDLKNTANGIQAQVAPLVTQGQALIAKLEGLV